MSSSKYNFSGLFIFEMANNHQGSVEHGIQIIKEMAAIARKYNVSLKELMTYNKIKNPNSLTVGQKLKIPRN